LRNGGTAERRNGGTAERRAAGYSKFSESRLHGGILNESQRIVNVRTDAGIEYDF